MEIEAPLVQAQDFSKPKLVVKSPPAEKPSVITKSPPIERPLVETAKVEPPKVDKSNEEKQLKPGKVVKERTTFSNLPEDVVKKKHEEH